MKTAYNLFNIFTFLTSILQARDICSLSKMKLTREHYGNLFVLCSQTEIKTCNLY